MDDTPVALAISPRNYDDANANLDKRASTMARLIKAIKDNHGLMVHAANAAGVSYITMNRYAQVPEVAAAIQEAKEARLDKTESRLFDMIDNAKEPVVPTLFHLKTQGKARGYVEQVQQAVVGDITIRVQFDHPLDKPAEPSST